MLNLAPYGLNWSIDTKNSNAVIIPDDYKSRLCKTTVKSSNYTVKRSDGSIHVYKKGAHLGSGTFGNVYECTMAGSSEYVVKEMKYEDEGDFKATLLETIIQIIVVKETEGSEHTEWNPSLKGPFAPRVYDFGYDSSTGKAFIFAEKMRKTIRTLISGWVGSANSGKDMAMTLGKIAGVLSELYTKLAFNHRDFKSDNIMYKKNSKGYTLRLIDFGMSCMTWNGIHLQAASTLFPTSHTCYRPSRDLSALFFEISDYVNSHLSKETRNLLHEFVILRVNGKNMNMLKELDWSNTYNFLNRKNVENPKATPTRVRKTIKSSKHQHRFTKKRCRH